MMTMTARIDRPANNSVSLKGAYNQRFNVIPARNRDQLAQVHRLRYQVYCIENNFEDPNIHPNGIEQDVYDARSVHSLLIDRRSGAVAGTVRLILPTLKTEQNFPIQGVCNSPLLAEAQTADKGRAAEISRFCISKEFRQQIRISQAGDSATTDLQDSAVDNNLLMPCITLGLMKAIVQMSAEHGITNWFAVMEQPLLRLLTRFGIYFKPIGAIVEYHGKRQPCHQNVEVLLARIKKERRDVWDVITDEGRLLEKLRRKVKALPTCRQRAQTYKRPFSLHA